MISPNIPGLPTDNLYKFISLSGVVLVILSYVLSYKDIRNIEYEVDEYITETQETFSDKNKWVSQVIYKIEKMEQEIENYTSWEDDPSSILKLYEEIESDYINNRVILDELQDYLETEDTIMTMKFSRLDDNKLLYWLMFLTGWGLMVKGFYWWYIKLQKPLDDIVKGESEKYKRASSKRRGKKNNTTKIK